MPPLPKPPSLRQRRNKSATRSMLPTEEQAAASSDVPELPPLSGKAKWHAMVMRWWNAVWKSPMASEYLEADKEALYLLARLQQDFWTAKGRIDRQKAAAEIRQQSVRFGLSPIDRYRLQWEVEKGEQAQDRTTSRRRAKKPQGGADPRDVLKLA